jgi:hypothetical protein
MNQHENHRPRSGVQVTLSPGGIVCTVSSVGQVGIANLADVYSHVVTTIAGSTSHVVQFRGGGSLNYAYNDRGELIELAGSGISLRRDASGNMLVQPFKAEARGR